MTTQQPTPAGRRRDHSRRRSVRLAIIVALCIAVGAALWFWVFPWVDRTFVNRPQVL